jgi:hypothetical protein
MDDVWEQKNIKASKLPDNVHPPLLYPAYGSTRVDSHREARRR